VDANIIVSALLKNSGTRKMLLSDKMPKLFVPEFIRQELFKYMGEFSKRLGVRESELEKAMVGLLDASKIEMVQASEYSEFMEKALETSPDPKDAPYFALALKLDCPIWSQDFALKKQSAVKVFSTAELLKKIE
jgi:predicted nucleic acid-binding protein